jgi:hypothetical protein
MLDHFLQTFPTIIVKKGNPYQIHINSKRLTLIRIRYSQPILKILITTLLDRTVKSKSNLTEMLLITFKKYQEKLLN